ncbi:unnamed protein product [Vicia faba]|uniref:Uncharacterized protein n=1 Tax=Vicia faba TaxID=3906 RepID=A0AAV1ABR1_VICFA|nr:unnamed protein product [Vicia faba]
MASTQPIVLVVVVVCAGGLVILSLLTFALFYFFKRNEKTQETDIIHIDEHKKGKETITPGPFGKQAVAISVEDDVHVDETRKNEKLGHGLQARSSSDIIRIDEHKKGNQTIVPGPFGQQAVVISVEDDLHVRTSHGHHHQLDNKS